VLGPVNRGDKRNVLRLQSAYLHEAHRMPILVWGAHTEVPFGARRRRRSRVVRYAVSVLD
jgi:hypothetical protein